MSGCSTDGDRMAGLQGLIRLLAASAHCEGSIACMSTTIGRHNVHTKKQSQAHTNIHLPSSWRVVGETLHLPLQGPCPKTTALLTLLRSSLQSGAVVIPRRTTCDTSKTAGPAE